MYILGINAFHGDSSASIFKDGELIVAIEEERIRRVKHWAGFPSRSIELCLDICSIDISQVDHITISRDPSANIYKKIIYSLKNRISFKNLKDRWVNRREISSIREKIGISLGVDTTTIKAHIHNIEHHRSHLASAFFASPFEESAILSIDGFGDFSSTMIAVGRGDHIEVLDSVIYPHSLGIFYTAFTQYLGFMNYGDEYKVMGLAPYGEPSLVEKVRDVIILDGKGLFEINVKYFNHHRDGVTMSWEGGDPKIETIYSEYMIEKFGTPRGKDEELTQYHKDLASSVQRVAEDTIFYILNHLQRKTDIKNISIAGGVAQNSVVNGKILSNTSFEKLYIPPASHDGGTAIGSSLWLYNQILKKPRIKPIYHSYFGIDFSDNEIESYLISIGVKYEKMSDIDLNNSVTDTLIDGGVVGWFQGKAEFGPRALGHRSILVDPRRDDAKEILNRKIKRREPFRPFAPSILEEFVDRYFETDDSVLFMEKVYQIKAEKRSEIKAVTHVDGSGRLHTVNKEIAPKYYDLIKTFYKKTALPILLNTSFNENEPIVNNPKEAYDCFARTKMDMVVMGNIVIKR
jgi:carbamoyltransferase